MDSLSASSVNLKIQMWISPDNLDVPPCIIVELLERVKQALDDVGIEIPVPHLQLLIQHAFGLNLLSGSWHPAQGQKIQGE